MGAHQSRMLTLRNDTPLPLPFCWRLTDAPTQGDPQAVTTCQSGGVSWQSVCAVAAPAQLSSALRAESDAYMGCLKRTR